MSRFKLDVGTATDMGRHRDHNEDYYATYVPRSERGSAMRGLLLVADGTGGGGASQMAVERVLEEISSGTHDLRSDGATLQALDEVLRRVIRETSDQMFRMGTTNGLGSTLAMVAFRSEEALVAHVGDSRCYRVRNGGIECLTCQGVRIAGEEASGRTLGRAVPPSVDVRAESLEDRDLFILCSDGLFKALSDSDILEISKRFVRPQDLAEALVALAIDKDGSDNATAVVCRCRDAARLEAEPEETEPIFLPGSGRDAAPWPRSRRWIGIVALLLVLVALFAVPRFLAIRAFDLGKQHALDGRYLHARREFATAIRLGLDSDRTEELIDILLRFPSSRPEAPVSVPERRRSAPER